jgi:hypothetical protein
MIPRLYKYCVNTRPPLGATERHQRGMRKTERRPNRLTKDRNKRAGNAVPIATRDVMPG